MKFINIKVFIASFIIGLLIVYYMTPEKEEIVKYPTPENAGKIVYKDDADVCYIYEAEEIECPKNKNEIKKIDLQFANNEKKNNQGIIDYLSSFFK